MILFLLDAKKNSLSTEIKLIGNKKNVFWIQNEKMKIVSLKRKGNIRGIIWKTQ